MRDCPDLDVLTREQVPAFLAGVPEEDSAPKAVLAERDAEIARLKGLKGRPDIRPAAVPGGMRQAVSAPPPSPLPRRGGGPKTARRRLDDDLVIKAGVPPGSRFKGYEYYVVRDLVIRPPGTRHCRERRVTPEGKTVIAPLPAGAGAGHFGPQLRRFVLTRYHQGQVTVARPLTQLRAIGIDVSKRQLVRLPIARQDGFVEEAGAVPHAGLETAARVTADDTGARHKGRNGVCTRIGTAHLTSFKTTSSKSRLNVPECLRGGHTDDVINADALAYMADRALTRA